MPCTEPCSARPLNFPDGAFTTKASKPSNVIIVGNGGGFTKGPYKPRDPILKDEDKAKKKPAKAKKPKAIPLLPHPEPFNPIQFNPNSITDALFQQRADLEPTSISPNVPVWAAQTRMDSTVAPSDPQSHFFELANDPRVAEVLLEMELAHEAKQGDGFEPSRKFMRI